MKQDTTDTIAAISTALSPSGIGIVRISGPEAIAIADRLFRAKNGRPLTEAAGNTIQYGHIEEQGELLDEVLVSVLRAPRTYTREDVVEINGHGGILVMRRLLDAVLTAGARLAEPGEFTKRAFLHGRLDLSQAEAVMDLIAGENRAALQSALTQLGGAMRQRIGALRDVILQNTAQIEAALDDPEHYDLQGFAPALEKTLQSGRAEIEALLSTVEEGRLLKEGIATVILGRPNVGKSTLLNLLAGAETAIVTDIAGTTRDVLEEQVTIQGVPLRLMDTAGLRESEDAIEQIGVARARERAQEADLLLYVLDASQPITAEDEKNLREWTDRNRIFILNKCDLPRRLSVQEIERLFPNAPVIEMAARSGEGLAALGQCIRDLFFVGEIHQNDQVYITNIRHKEALSRAKTSLDLALESLAAGMPEDLYTVDLMDAYAALGEITGEEVGEDLIEEIFSRFCLGK